MKIEQHKYRVLDSWRGLCAILVSLYHFRHEVYSHLNDSDFINNSWIFVDFFFVLSGFVIFANYEEKLREGFGFWRFMILRFGRVYPLHFFILMGLVGLELAQMFIPQIQDLAHQPPFGGEDNRIADLPAQFLLLQAMGVSDRLSFNFPSWTISAEFYAYALFAMLIIFFRKNIHIVLTLVMICAGSFLAIKLGKIVSTYEFGFIRCIYSFALGALVWRWFHNHHEKTAGIIKTRNLQNVLEVGMVMVLIIATALMTNMATLVMPFLFGAAIVLFALEQGVVSRLFLKAPFLWLGAWSYSIYMLHNPIDSKVFGIVFKALFKFFPGHESVVADRKVWGDALWQGDLIVIAFLLAVILASVFTYTVIEVPCRNFFRRLARSSRPRSPVVQTVKSG